MMKALVIGGTGVQGPLVVEGLLDRGYQVTILHSGQHEVEFIRPVEHLHGDAHFKETLEETLGNRTYELVISMYGRLRIVAEVMKGRTGRLVAVGGGGGYANTNDPRWGGLGRPLAPDESGVWQIDEADKFAYLIHMSEEAVLAAHRDGAYNATILRPGIIYGPGQPLPPKEWCVVRRILDGRKRMIIADGGHKVEARLYSENGAAAILLAVDKPKDSAGKRYNVRDGRLYTFRQLIEYIARTMGHELDLIDMPYEVAKPCHPLWSNIPSHLASDDRLIRDELGHKDKVTPEEGIARTVRRLVESPLPRGGEQETQLGDSFDYAAEDELIGVWEESKSKLAAVQFSVALPAHPYRHPKHPGDTWQRPSEDSSFTRATPH